VRQDGHEATAVVVLVLTCLERKILLGLWGEESFESFPSGLCPHQVEILTQSKCDKTAVQHLLYQLEQALAGKLKKEVDAAKVRQDRPII
jgi:hypothetical protein